MADYKEVAITGTEWTRARSIVCDNERGGTPKIVFTEEIVTSLSSGVTTAKAGRTLSKEFAPDGVIDVYDPVSLQKTGATMTHAELYAVLLSAYMTVAAEADANG